MVKVVTSCTGEQWERYGREMAQSVYRHLSQNTVVYGEDMDGVTVDEPTEVLNLFEAEPECKAFIDRNEEWTAPIVRERGYQFDACKFARKVFAIRHAVQHAIHNELVVWLDADVIVTNQVPDRLFQDFGNARAEIAILDRDHTHTESGLIIFKATNKMREFADQLAGLYQSDSLFHLAGWTDCHALDFSMKMHNTSYLSLSGKARQGMNPFNEGPLGQWMSHYKGPNKLQQNPNVRVEATANRYRQLIDIIDQVKPKSICEIGTWNGDRAVKMMKRAYRYRMNAEYWGFDLFEDATEATDSAEFNVKPHHNVREVAQKLRSHGVECHLTKGNTRETLQSLPSDKTFDLAFIDGGHSVETIRSDYEFLKDRARVIVFDDYYEGIDTDQFGCNKVLEGLGAEILPIKDTVAGGGTVQMAVLRADAA